METNRLEQGEKLLSEALGKDSCSHHPVMSIGTRSLARIWKLQGRDNEAIKLVRQCLKVQSATLGSSHPVTVESVRLLEEWTGDNNTIAPDHSSELTHRDAGDRSTDSTGYRAPRKV
jgi:5-methylthioribose kinase